MKLLLKEFDNIEKYNQYLSSNKNEKIHKVDVKFSSSPTYDNKNYFIQKLYLVWVEIA